MGNTYPQIPINSWSKPPLVAPPDNGFSFQAPQSYTNPYSYFPQMYSGYGQPAMGQPTWSPDPTNIPSNNPYFNSYPAQGQVNTTGLPSSVTGVPSMATPPIVADPPAPLQPQSGMGIAGAVFGPIQAGVALYNMHQMSKETKPGYAMSGDLSTAIGDARKYKDQGFTASQRAAYEQQIGEGETNAYKAATSMGGGIDQTVMAILKGNNTQARNQYGIADANQQVQNRQYFGNMAQVGQNQKNLQSTEDLKDWWYRKNSDATLLNAGITNTAQGISSGAIKALTAGLG